MNPTEHKIDRDYILYDADILNIVDSTIFDPEALRSANLMIGETLGRGNTFFYEFSKLNLVLRHYRRGGRIASVLGDRYLYTGIRNTRAWREFRLLAHLHQHGLPVPRPVAARVSLHMPFTRGDLVTRRIESAQTLASLLSARPLADDSWYNVGRTLRRFHDKNVFHADLNAHNILLDEEGGVYLIDFDRGRLMSHSKSDWQQDNLRRLLRSLNKLAGTRPVFHFIDNDWHKLKQGYLA